MIRTYCDDCGKEIDGRPDDADFGGVSVKATGSEYVLGREHTTYSDMGYFVRKLLCAKCYHNKWKPHFQPIG